MLLLRDFKSHFWDEDTLLWKMLALSFFLHVILFNLGKISWTPAEKPTMEIDLTSNVSLGPLKKSGTPHAAAKPIPKKEWVKPSPRQKPLPAPKPQSTPAEIPQTHPNPLASKSEGSGLASSGTGIQVSRYPQLVNLNQLQALLKKFYPEEARLKHIESTVVLDIHLDSSGHVIGVNLVKSGGSDFDAAAIKAAKLLRFTPAYIGDKPVAVKIRQAISFKIGADDGD